MKSPGRIVALIVGLLMVSTPYVGAKNRDISRIGQLTHMNKQVGTYRALLIGIQDYNDSHIPDLETPLSDVRKIGAILKNRYGFKVETLLDKKATREAMYKALRQLASTAKANDSVLIYYAGHGDLDRQYNDGWWIPVDAVGGNPLTYLDNIQVQKAMKNMAARHVLLISDSCYSGTLFGLARAMPPVINDKYYLNLYNEKSRWGMTSGNKTPVSDSGTAGHSVFAYQLIKKLEGNEKPYVSTQEIYTDIAPIISNNSQQTPMCRPIRQTGDQGGEFIFIASSQGDPPPPPPETGSLRVKSQPSGAKIFMDTLFKGHAPIDITGVTPGVYGVLGSLDGYIFQEKKVRVNSGRRAMVTLTLDPVKTRARLFVTPNPADARVRIMNISDKYYNGIELDPGRYKVEVSSTGYITKTQWVDIGTSGAASGGIDLYVELEEEPEPGPGPGPTPGQVWKESVTGMAFVWVPGGEFMMGSTAGDADEKPVHKVALSGFWMGKYEVTQGQWQQIMGNNPSGFKKGNEFPVERVSWKDANAFIKKLNNRAGHTFTLPSEAQWEYAARSGGKNQKYSGGDDVNRFAWYNKNSSNSTHKVGTKMSNDLGIHDMSGNVWEWCQDIYAKDAYKKHSSNNPIYAQSGSRRVYRGGSWGSYLPADVRCANRDGNTPDYRNDYLGFRLLRTN